MNGYNKPFQKAVKAYPTKMKPKVQESRILWENKYKQRQGTYMTFWGQLPKQPEEPLAAVGTVKSEVNDNTPEKISEEKISVENKYMPTQTKVNNDLSEIQKKIAKFHIIQSKVDLN